MNILLDFVFENGAVAQLRFCPMTGAVLERITVNLEDHSYFLKLPIWNGLDMPGELQHIEKGRLVSSVSGLEVSPCQEMYVTDGFYAENKAFFDAVKAGRKSANDIESALQSVRIAQAIRERASVLSLGNRLR